MLEYVFETDQEDLPQTVAKEKSGRDRSELYDDLLPHPDRGIGDWRNFHNAGHILAGLLFGPVDKRTGAPDVLRCRPAQRKDR
jgi:hypothetical protein